MIQESSLVSILVPVFRVEKYIERCARSLFEQTYSNIEYIFVNDCTPDNSIEILENILRDYPHRATFVKVINHDFNKGLSVARNTGLFHATGRYVTFVDSDDYIDSNAIEKLVKKIEQDNSDIVVYDIRYIYSNKTFVQQQNVSYNSKEFVSQLLRYELPVCVCGKLYKRSLFYNNDINFINGLNVGEDYVTTPRIAYYSQSISYCQGVYYNYIQYNPSSYTNNFKHKNIEDIITAINYLSSFFQSKNNYTDYASDLDAACLINKVKLITSICLNYDRVGDQLPRISNLWKDKESTIARLPLSYKITLWLANNRYFLCLRLYILFGFRLKSFIKKFL